MLFVEIVTDQLENITVKNKQSICYYLNPITDINILSQELEALKQANNNLNILEKNINYLSLFNMELDYLNELHKHYNKSDVIIDNNKAMVINPDFKKYCTLIKKELRKIIKKLENMELEKNGSNEKWQEKKS